MEDTLPHFCFKMEDRKADFCFKMEDTPFLSSNTHFIKMAFYLSRTLCFCAVVEKYRASEAEPSSLELCRAQPILFK